MNELLQLLPLVILLGFNIAFGVVAMKMAARRGLRSVPAFWSGFFTMPVALVFIAMHPIKEN